MAYKFVGQNAQDFFGVSLSAAGDVDGDGVSELLIGAPFADGGGSNSGQAYLVNSKNFAEADAADRSIDGIIKIENLVSLSGSYKFVGTAIDDYAGTDVSSAGDVDGDGKSDLLIAADFANDARGEVYLMNAKDLAAADSADSNTDGVIQLSNVAAQTGSYTLIGGQTGETAGTSVASAGDTDKDGKSDILIGVEWDNENGASSGAAYLVTGGNLAAADLADGTTDGKITLNNAVLKNAVESYKFLGTKANDQSGHSVASAGDVDGDGKDDLLISTSPIKENEASSPGSVHLITAAALQNLDKISDPVGKFDGAIDLDKVAGQSGSYVFTGRGLEDEPAVALSSAGDVDGDGKADLVIGVVGKSGEVATSSVTYVMTAAGLVAADAADGTTDGKISVSNIPLGANSYEIIGTPVEGRAGFSVSSAGDIDGDGKDDLLIGAPTADGGGTDSGEFYLIAAADLQKIDEADGFSGGTIRLENVAVQSGSYKFVGINAQDNAGISVTSVGDLTGDGKVDLLVGAGQTKANPGKPGEAYLIDSTRLADYDALDGKRDGVIDLETIALSPTDQFKLRETEGIIDPTNLDGIRDYDGNNLGASDGWKFIGKVDVEYDGDVEFIYINQELGRWATVGPDPTGTVNFNDHGQGGDTRVVGVYIDPQVQNGNVEKGSPNDSQKRFENDLRIDNLTVKDAFDFDGDGFQEVYFKVNDGTAYLRALMHADGNIQYANYQNEQQVEEYLTGLGYDQSVLDTILS